MKKPLISVVVNTIDGEEENLARCLESVRRLADEIVVIDMCSKDKGRQVAKSFGAEVYPHKYLTYVEPARNFAISKAKGKWILVLDPDEKISRTLARRLRNIIIDEDKKDLDCVLIPRKNIILGKWMQNSRWWPDYLPRFFRKGRIRWPKEIHQQPNLSGKKIHTLLDSERFAIVHYNYESLDQFLERTKRYAEARAKELVKEKNYKLSNKDLLIKPLEEFLNRFFIGEAYKDGVHGLALSLLQAWAALLIYLKVWEIQKYAQKPLEPRKVKEIISEAAYQLGYWRDDFIASTSSSALAPILKPFLKIRTWLTKL